MSTISKVEFTRKKRDLPFDKARGVWYGYQVDVRANGKRYRNVLATKQGAEEFIRQLQLKKEFSKAGLKLQLPNRITVAKLFEARLARITNKKENIRATRVFAAFEAMLDTKPLVTAIRKAHIQNYINRRLETGVKPITVDREVTILSTALLTAGELFPMELEDYEPPAIARPSYSKKKRKRHVITETERDRIVDAILTAHKSNQRSNRTASRPTVARMFKIGWLLGLRFSEVRRLLKSDFNAAERSLRVIRWKTGDVTMLEFLPDAVVEILSSSDSATDHIFDLNISETTFAKIIKEACEIAGVTYGRSALDGITFHSTRHSFTSRLVQVTDIATAQTFTGHSNAEMVNYYSHASDESRKQAMGRMYPAAGAVDLREIYEQIQSGNMTFDEFKNALK